MLTPLITTIPSSLDHSSSLPSHLFSPHPLWSHRNPFHFLHCRQRFFNNANLIGSLLCSKPFNSFPLSSVPCGKSTCLRENVCACVCVCACTHVHSCKGGWFMILGHLIHSRICVLIHVRLLRSCLSPQRYWSGCVYNVLPGQATTGSISSYVLETSFMWYKPTAV